MDPSKLYYINIFVSIHTYRDIHTYRETAKSSKNLLAKQKKVCIASLYDNAASCYAKTGYGDILKGNKYLDKRQVVYGIVKKVVKKA